LPETQHFNKSSVTMQVCDTVIKQASVAADGLLVAALRSACCHSSDHILNSSGCSVAATF
jgi:hypothetical protein